MRLIINPTIKVLVLTMIMFIGFMSFSTASTSLQDTIFTSTQSAASGAASDQVGITIIANRTLTLTSVNSVCTTGFSLVFLKNETGGQIANATLSGSTATFPVNTKMYIGKKYRIEAQDTGTATHYWNATTLPKNTTSFTLLNGSFNGADYLQNLYCINAINYTVYETSSINNLANSVHECQAGDSNMVFSMSARNESTNREQITFKTNSMILNYKIGNQTTSNSYTFTSDNEIYSNYFCYNSSADNLDSNVTISYSNSNSPQRDYFENFTLNSTTTSRDLYLLPTALGIYTRYKTLDAQSNLIIGAYAGVQKISGSSVYNIASGFTDSSGQIAIFLNPETTYYYTFSKTGKGATSFSLTPNSLETYNVVLGSGALSYISNGTQIYQNLSYTISPDSSNLTQNVTTTFSLTANSTWVYTINFMSINITDSNGKQVGYATSTSQGTVSTNVFTGYNQTLTAKITIRNTLGEEFTSGKQWVIANYYTGDYSLTKQLTLFGTYGFSPFVRILISMIVITLIMVYMSKNEVIDTSESKVAVLILMVWIFSLVGWLSTGFAVGSTNPLTLFGDQYGIAIITTAIGVSIVFREVFT